MVLPSSLGVPCPVLVRRTPTEAMREIPLLWNAFKPNTQTLSWTQTPRPSCRAHSQTEILTTTTYHLILPSFAEDTQSTCSGFPPTENVPGNEAAECLGKNGTTKEQVDGSASYAEVKIILKATNARSGGTSTHATTGLTSTTY